jgi:hypothetical protein
MKTKQADEYVDLSLESTAAGRGEEATEFLRIAENMWMLIQHAEALGRAPELREEIDFIATRATN